MKPVFDGYSRYYDLLYQGKDYAAEAEYVLSRIRLHRPEANRILELGCGTGAHAVALAQCGMVVHGVDLSHSMLARAQARIEREPQETRSRISLAPGDLRTLRTGATYDVVAALFHVMSYQNANRDLALAFETAATHLLPGALFVFDFWYGPAVLTQRPEVRVLRLSDRQCAVTRIAQPLLRSTENIVDVNYTLFIEETASNAITRVQETHSMRYLFLPELELLMSDWFEPVDILGWNTTAPPDIDTWSGFATLKRK